MSMEDLVADRLGRIAAEGFDIFKIAKEALKIYQDPNFSLTKNLDIALLSLMAMVEGPKLKWPKTSFMNFYLIFDGCNFQYTYFDQRLSTLALAGVFAPQVP